MKKRIFSALPFLAFVLSIAPTLADDASRRGEDIDWTGFRNCREALTQVFSGGGLIQVPFRSEAEAWMLFVAKRNDRIGVYIMSFGLGAGYFAALPADPKGVGISNIDLEARIPGASPIPMTVSFSDAHWVASGFNNPSVPGSKPLPAVQAEPVRDFQFRFAMELALESSLRDLPSTYLAGAASRRGKYCRPKKLYLETLDTCAKSENLKGTAAAIRRRFDFVTEVECPHRLPVLD